MVVPPYVLQTLRSQMQCTTSLVVVGGGDDLVSVHIPHWNSCLSCMSYHLSFVSLAPSFI